MTFLTLVIRLCCILICYGTNGRGLSLSTVPIEIVPEFTKTFVINCSFTTDGDIPLKYPDSLHISKHNGSNIESIAIINQQNVIRSEHVRHGQIVKASGTVEANGSSSLVVSWPNPMQVDAGLYQCSVLGIDTDELPYEDIAIATVITKEPSREDLFAKIIELKDELKQCTGYLADIGSSCNETLLESQALSEFYPPRTFNGHRYLLSKQNFVTDVDSSRKCELLGGYLAEVDSKEEQAEIVTMMREHPVFGTLVAGTDVATEDTWIIQRTGLGLTYFDWNQGEPTNFNSDEDCLSISSGQNGHMNDIPCSNTQNAYLFLCEIPGRCLN
ncbi:Mannose-binding protein C [Bulinus truncatus]|nr:Mannose-binding protein C [Bulinus truncatus]